MPNFATATIAGHLGRRPETRTVNGQTVTSFSIATNHKGKTEDLTTWWNCTAWGRPGELIAQYLDKGDAILVQGPIHQRPYTTRDGRDATSLELNVKEFTFLGSRDSRDANPAAPQRPTDPQAPVGTHPRGAAPEFNDDIPF